MRRTSAVIAVAALLLTVLAVLAGCGSGSSSGSAPAPRVVLARGADVGHTYDAALSTPRKDTVYPYVGSPSVDALLYQLDLRWSPSHETLTGTETLLFRATTTGGSFRLDLAHQLDVGQVWLDGRSVRFDHVAKDLVVEAAVVADTRHTLQLTYSGVPEPVKAPTDRPDFDTTGWTTMPDGSAWTMQEPFGAYTWYAVNDHPSDKAFYDITVHVPSPMVGVANGRLESRTEKNGITTTHWSLPEPSASYLVTISVNRFKEATDTGPHGLPITYWVPADQPRLIAKLRYAPKAIAYLEGRLGPYPFPTLGVLVVAGNSAMETQSTITLGDNDYALSHDVIVHELAHQWYGDEVTPDDWSDLWMNEGMATYLAEATWTGSHGPEPRTAILRRWQTFTSQMRMQWGPPAHYATGSFGEGNVYYIPALMWDTLRQRLGDREFWTLVRQWPRAERFTSQDRASLAAWWSRQSGTDLTSFFHRWLLGRPEPPWHAG
jgi:aminopeptidase N